MDATTTSDATVPAIQHQLWRSDPLTNFVRALSKWALSYHRVVVEGEEHVPREGAVLILPKHCAYRDILVEGVILHKLLRRNATYVMKVGLPGLMELVGGVKIVRPKDIRRIKDREARRRRIEWARSRNRETLDYLAWLYGHDECVISHPEGTRCADFMGPLQKEVVEHMISVERERSLRIPIVPMGLEYESFRVPRSAVFIRFGTPMYSDQFDDVGALMTKIDKRLRSLSFAQPAKLPR